MARASASVVSLRVSMKMNSDMPESVICRTASCPTTGAMACVQRSGRAPARCPSAARAAAGEPAATPPIACKGLFKIPAGLSPAHATFTDPLSDAICGHKDIAIGLDQTVAVIGAGPVGIAHCALARAQGAAEVL